MATDLNHVGHRNSLNEPKTNASWPRTALVSGG